MPGNGDDRVGWDAVGPEFWTEYRDKARRAANLLQRLRELPIGGENSPARVRVWQAIRELDFLPPDHIFYVIAWELAAIAGERQRKLYASDFAHQFRAIYEAHGVDYDDLEAIEEWTEVPEELEDLNNELAEQEDGLREKVYLEFGETERADLWLNDRATFDERWRKGQELAHPGLQTRLEQMIRGEIDAEDVFGPDQG